MTLIIPLWFCLVMACWALGGLLGLGCDDRAGLGVAQGLARFGLGVGGGQPGAVLRAVEAGQGFEEVFEILEGGQAVLFGGGDEGVIPGADLPIFSRPEEEGVLFADGGGPDRSFHGVVVQRQVGVVQHGQEVGPFIN
jgi:hypothetical protein